jgi:hypothetical protein
MVIVQKTGQTTVVRHTLRRGIDVDLAVAA